MAFEILEMSANLLMSGMKKARQEMKTTERSANSLERALEAVDNAATGWRRLEQSLERVRDALTKTRAAAAKNIVVRVVVEGAKEALADIKAVEVAAGRLAKRVVFA